MALAARHPPLPGPDDEIERIAAQADTQSREPEALRRRAGFAWGRLATLLGRTPGECRAD